MTNSVGNTQDPIVNTGLQSDLFREQDTNLETLSQQDKAAALTQEAMNKLEVIAFSSMHADLNVLSYDERAPLQKLIEVYTDFVVRPNNFVNPENGTDYHALMVAIEHVTYLLSAPHLLQEKIHRDKLKSESEAGLLRLSIMINGPLPVVVHFRSKVAQVISAQSELQLAA